MKLARRGHPAAALTLALALLAPHAASALNLTWINAAGGPAGNAANWNPAQVPVATDWLTFGLASTYSVTFGSAVPASDEFAVTAGSVTFRFPTAHTNSTVLAVPVSGSSATATIESGSLTLQQNLYLGQNAGTSGTLTVTGAGTSVAATSATGVTMVGDQGTATLNVLDGATVTVSNSPEVGDRAGGNGTVVIGGVSTVSPFPRAELIVHNSPTDPFEVGSGGTGAAGVLLGGRVQIDGTLQLGRNASGSGAFSVAGASGSDTASVEIGGDLKIARNDTNGSPAGTGTYYAGTNGITDVAGTTYTYDPDGSTGQLQLREGGRFETGSLSMQDPASELDFTGGLLRVRGGSLVSNGQAIAINSATGTPTLELLDGAQCSLNSPAGPALEVGHDAMAGMRILSGSDVSVHSFNAVVGRDAGSDGTLELGDAGSTLNVDSTLIVGRAGAGTFLARGASQANLYSLGVSTQPTGYGTVHVEDAGTSLHVVDQFELSGLASGGSGASGSVVVQNGADLWLDRPLISGDVWPNGQLYAYSGGTIHLAGVLANRGQFTISDGRMTGGALTTIANGQTSGTGVIESSVVALTDTTGLIEVSGAVLAGAPERNPERSGAGTLALTLGNPASALGFHHLGRLDLNGGDVTLQDADSAVAGTVILGGGTLHAPPGGLSLAPGHRLRGSGTVTGAFRPQGYVLATGASGITFTGPVLATGQGMNGTRFRFAAGGSFLGYGRIESSIVVDSGAVVAPIADVTLGGAPVASRVDIAGVLAVGPNREIDLNGTDSTRVSGLVSMLGGFLQCAPTSPVLIQAAGRLAGNGTVTGDAVIDGTLDPGAGARYLKFANLTLRGTSHVLYDVGAYATGEHDSIGATGNVSIGGTLDIRTLPGFVPVVGDSFRVILAGSVSGTFATMTVNGVPGAAAVQLVYTTNSVWAKIVGTVDAPGAGIDPAHRVSFATLGSPARALVFALDLPEAASVTVELFDPSGRRVATLQDGALSPGRHRLGDAGARVAAGLYFARATVRGPHGTEVRTARAVRVQ